MYSKSLIFSTVDSDIKVTVGHDGFESTAIYRVKYFLALAYSTTPFLSLLSPICSQFCPVCPFCRKVCPICPQINVHDKSKNDKEIGTVKPPPSICIEHNMITIKSYFYLYLISQQLKTHVIIYRCALHEKYMNVNTSDY